MARDQKSLATPVIESKIANVRVDRTKDCSDPATVEVENCLLESRQRGSDLPKEDASLIEKEHKNLKIEIS